MNPVPDRRKMRMNEKLFYFGLSAILSVGGFFGARLYASVDRLDRDKLDKEVYYNDVRLMRQDIKTLIDMHLEAGYKRPKNDKERRDR